MRLFYSILLCIMFPYFCWRIGVRHRWKSIPWKEYFAYRIQKNTSEKPLVWVHTVSLGEAKAAIKLTQQLQQEGYVLYLTCTTLTAKKWLQTQYPNTSISMLPFDLPWITSNFIKALKPRLGILVEAEYWPNLIHQATKNGVKLMLANARLSARSARRFRWSGGLMRQMITSFDTLIAQTHRDCGRLRCYGAKSITVATNLKFDIDFSDLPSTTINFFNGRKVLLLASTRSGEEALLLPSKDDLFWQSWLVILAPRHLERCDEIIYLLQQKNLPFVRHSLREKFNSTDKIYLADSIGEMDRWYQACDVAIIGGSFLPYGGQNPIEAMSTGVPVIIGPYIDNYKQLVKQAHLSGALLKIPDAKVAIETVSFVYLNRDQFRHAALHFCKNQTGSTQKHFQIAQQLLQ